MALTLLGMAARVIGNGSRPPLPTGEKEASNRYSYSTESSHTMAGRTPLVNDVATRIPFLFYGVKYLFEKNLLPRKNWESGRLARSDGRIDLPWVLRGTKHPNALQPI